MPEYTALAVVAVVITIALERWSGTRVFTLAFPGPDFDYDLVRSWLRWRDAKNGS